jgi:hypothetical protein
VKIRPTLVRITDRQISHWRYEITHEMAPQRHQRSKLLPHAHGYEVTNTSKLRLCSNGDSAGGGDRGGRGVLLNLSYNIGTNPHGHTRERANSPSIHQPAATNDNWRDDHRPNLSPLPAGRTERFVCSENFVRNADEVAGLFVYDVAPP